MIEKVTTYILRNELSELRNLLKNNNIDLNQIDNEIGKSPLHCACKEKNLDAVKTLLEIDADINLNIHDKTEEHTPLHTSVLYNAIDIIKLLIDKGADINSKNKHGNTPLWLAVMHNKKNNKVEIIKLLLENGADPQIKNNHGNSLYKALSMPKNKDIVELFPPEE